MKRRRIFRKLKKAQRLLVEVGAEISGFATSGLPEAQRALQVVLEKIQTDCGFTNNTLW
jgi:hypothetical protein